MQIGDTYEYKNVVTKEITAGALGSGGLDIFATPFLICWMEAAAYYYMKEQLPEGKSSVGTMVNVRHVSPSPIGAEITANLVETVETLYRSGVRLLGTRGKPPFTTFAVADE